MSKSCQIIHVIYQKNCNNMTCSFHQTQQTIFDVEKMPTSTANIDLRDIDVYTFNRSIERRGILFPGWCCQCSNRNIPKDQATSIAAINANTGDVSFRMHPFFACDDLCQARLLSRYYYDDRYLIKTADYVEPVNIFYNELVSEERLIESMEEMISNVNQCALNRDLWKLKLDKNECCICHTKDNIMLKAFMNTDETSTLSIGSAYAICGDKCNTLLYARYQYDGRYLVKK